MLSQQAIESFRRLYFEQYGEEISLDEAKVAAERLVGLFALLAGERTAVLSPVGQPDKSTQYSRDSDWAQNTHVLET